MRVLRPYAVPLSGPMLVEASAGTGKTHAISILALRGVVELGLMPERLLVVTFTRAATAELRARIRARLRLAREILAGAVSDDHELAAYLAARPNKEQCEKRLSQALLAIDEAAIFTIHGFCQRVLKSHAFETGVGFDRELSESLDSLVDQIISDFLVRELGGLPREVLELVRDGTLDEANLSKLMALLLSQPDLVVEPEGEEAGVDAAGRAHAGAAKTWEPLLALRSDFEQTRAALRKSTARLPVLSRLEARSTSRRKNFGANSRPKKACDAFDVWQSLPLYLLEDCAPVEKLLAMDELVGDPLEAELKCSVEAFKLLGQGVLRERVRLRQRFVAYAKAELAVRKQRLLVESYTDLLSCLEQALSSEAGAEVAARLRARYPLALIDEFQDTDRIQCRVLSRIYAGTGGTMVVIGDPKQSIYSFRGADVQGYLRVAHRPSLQRYELSVNYRSDPSLVLGISALYRQHETSPFGEGIDYAEVSARPGREDVHGPDGALVSGVELLVLPNSPDAKFTKARAQSLAERAGVDWVRGLLAGGLRLGANPVRPSDVAVLTRTHTEAERIHHALLRAGLRSVQAGNASVLSSLEARGLATLMAAILSPGSPRAVSAALLGPILGVSPSALSHFAEDETMRDDWAERLHRFGQVWQYAGPAPMLAEIFDELSVVERLLGEPGGERAVTNLSHLGELLQAVRTNQGLGRRAQLKWLKDAAERSEDVAREMRELRIESDEQAVQVVTVHRSKGLQYPFVLLPYAWSSREFRAGRGGFLLTRRAGLTAEATDIPVLRLDPELMGPEATRAEAACAEQERAEQARLLYVALTRARHAVGVVVADTRGFEDSALGALLGPVVGSCFGTTSPERTLPSRVTEHGPKGAIRIRALDGLVGDGVTPPRDAASAPSLREPAPLVRAVSMERRTTSFTALVKRDAGGIDPARDTDGQPAQPVTTKERGRVPVVMAELVAGPHVGEALHEILEKMDFASFGVDSPEPDVEGILRRFGIDEARFGSVVRRGLLATVRAPLLADDPAFSLSTVVKSEKCSELEFTLPVRSLSRDLLAERLGPALTGMGEDYQKTLLGLSFSPVKGCLRGYIDLVFRHRGRLYVVDYKSNRLGDTQEDYGAEELARAMGEHHYPLQAALYAWAVHKWLSTSERDYAYEQHFGGVLYVFLRGLAEGQAPGHSVFFHRPSLDALRQLGEFFPGAGRDARHDRTRALDLLASP